MVTFPLVPLPLVSIPCISCYKVLSANKKLNNLIVDMHKYPASSILGYNFFFTKNLSFLSGTLLCTSHHHRIANHVEMPFGEDPVRDRETRFTSVMSVTRISSLCQCITST